MSSYLLLSLLFFLPSRASAQVCFASTEELRDAVDAYLEDPSEESAVAQTYGYPIGWWCVRYIQDFSYLFSSLRNSATETFNEDLRGWVTVNARDMSFMFAGAKTFDGNISTFETGRVKTMQGMFEDAAAFNGDISQWDVFNVKDFSYMFHGATSFEGDLSDWKLVCAENLSFMFYTAVRFNSDVSGWNVGSVVDFRFMFDDAEVFRQNLCPWNAKMSKEVTKMDLSAMFAGTDCPVTDSPGPVQSGEFTTFCYSC